MEFVKNKVGEIWQDQAFVSSQMDGLESRSVALEAVTHSFSHFIVEHWIPAQEVLVSLYDLFCQDCWAAHGIAHHGHSSSKPLISSQASPIPVPPPGSQQGNSAPNISTIPSLISNSSAGSFSLYYFTGAQRCYQEASGQSVFIDKTASTMLSFFSSDEGKVGDIEDVLGSSEEEGSGLHHGGVPEGIVNSGV